MVVGRGTSMSFWTVDLLQALAEHFHVTIFDNRGVGYTTDDTVDAAHGAADGRRHRRADRGAGARSADRARVVDGRPDRADPRRHPPRADVPADHDRRRHRWPELGAVVTRGRCCAQRPERVAGHAARPAVPRRRPNAAERRSSPSTCCSSNDRSHPQTLDRQKQAEADWATYAGTYDGLPTCSSRSSSPRAPRTSWCRRPTPTSSSSASAQAEVTMFAGAGHGMVFQDTAQFVADVVAFAT